MKKTITILATALLASSILVGAQVTKPETEQDLTQPEAMASPMVKSYEPNVDNESATRDTQMRNQDEESQQKDHDRIKPDDPGKSPFTEPRDWNFISTFGGGN